MTGEMSEVTFTKEGAEERKRWIRDLYVNNIVRGEDVLEIYHERIDARTEREFPCPGCGEEMRIKTDDHGSYFGECKKYKCEVLRTPHGRHSTKRSLSEALTK